MPVKSNQTLLRNVIPISSPVIQIMVGTEFAMDLNSDSLSSAVRRAAGSPVNRLPVIPVNGIVSGSFLARAVTL
jgi:hypothetical protein